MIIARSFELPVGRDEAARALLDVPTISQCVPGVTGVREQEPDTYEATLAVAVGPIRSEFEGTVQVDRTAAPARLAAHGSGRDAGTGSSATIQVVATLHEVSPGTTRVDASCDLTIRGRLGQFGTGIIRATADQMLQDFTGCLAGRLRAGALASPPVSPSPLGFVRLSRTVLRGLLARLRGWFSSRGRQRGGRDAST